MSSPKSSNYFKKNIFKIRSEGMSMFPLLQPGDSIEFQRISPKQVKINDIVLLYCNETFITHRVVYRSGDGIVTRGDNNPKEDEGVSLEHVIARATRFKRKGKWFTFDDVYANQSIAYIPAIVEVSRSLKKSSIRHVYIKGLVASLKYLNRFPARIYGDIDLLIKREDIAKTNTVFTALGYHRYDDPWLSFREPTPLVQRFEVDYIKKLRGINVVFDVHLEPVFLMIKMKGMDLLYRNTLRSKLGDHFIANATSLSVMGTKVPVCSPPDQVLYLLLHIFHNNCTDSIRFHLVDQVIRKTMKPISWKKFVDTVVLFKLDGYIYPSLVMLLKYFDTPIPQKLIVKLKPKNLVTHLATQWVLNKTNIFRTPSRILGGIIRFGLVIALSPEPLYRKVLLLFHPAALTSAIWIGIKKLQTVILRRKIERSA